MLISNEFKTMELVDVKKELKIIKDKILPWQDSL
jgi:hypothetical protein